MAGKPIKLKVLKNEDRYEISLKAANQQFYSGSNICENQKNMDCQNKKRNVRTEDR